MKYIAVAVFLLSPSLSLISPMTKPNGDTDMASVISHVTLLEQTVSNLRSQIQSEARANAAQFALLQRELTKTQTDLQASVAEVTTLKAQLILYETRVNDMETKMNGTASKVNKHIATAGAEIDALKRVSASGIQSSTRNREGLANLTARVDTTEHELIKAASNHKVDNSTAHGLNEIRRHLGTLEGNVSATTTSLESTKQSVFMLSKDINVLKTSVSASQRQIQLLITTLNGIQTLGHVTGNPLGPIATMAPSQLVLFHAELRPSTVALSRLEPIKFDNVLLETAQQSYNPTVGRFTCPKSGFYIIMASATFFERSNARKSLQIHTGNSILATGAASTSSNVMFGDTQVSTISHLTKGEHVWCSFNRNVQLQGSHPSFTVALLTSGSIH